MLSDIDKFCRFVCCLSIHLAVCFFFFSLFLFFRCFFALKSLSKCQKKDWKTFPYQRERLSLRNSVGTMAVSLVVLLHVHVHVCHYHDNKRSETHAVF